MTVQKITLEQVLDARERRAEIQNKMLRGFASGEESSGKDEGICLVCLTMNIAGEIKRTPMTKMLFDCGVAQFEDLGFRVVDSLIIDEVTGSEAFWLVQYDPSWVKKMLVAVESSFPAARLFDFDVLVLSGEPHGEPHEEGSLVGNSEPPAIKKLSRGESRPCLVCGGPAAECARSRNHGLDAVKAATNALLKEFCAENLADDACNALIRELYTTPKPGLVDLVSCGAHTDMDVPVFEASAASLKPYFYDAAKMGMEGCSMADLRVRGLRAEQEMLAATGGVNTHKGMIYSMGLLLAGAGKALTCRQDSSVAEQSIRNAATLAREDAEAMLAKSADYPSTNGGRVLKLYGAKGAMWEAASGFPDAVYCADRLSYYMDKGFHSPGALAICDSMARLEDTNLLHRGGQEGLDFVRQSASEISTLPPEDRIPELFKLDKKMIERNLSPGGSADMLALAFFIDRLSKL